MVTDQQVRRLFKLVQTEQNFGISAMKAGMVEKMWMDCGGRMGIL